MGEIAELAFMYRAACEGIGVAKPYGESHPYDFLVQHGRRLLRVQVKSCFSPEQPGHTGFPIIVACHWGRGKLGYSIEQVDFIVAFIARYAAWYVIPIEALGKSKNIRLYPSGKKLMRPGGFYEKYRDAWQLMKDGSDASPQLS
jgi:PD-(D/E)XK nuclease superfamily protein